MSQHIVAHFNSRPGPIAPPLDSAPITQGEFIR